MSELDGFHPPPANFRFSTEAGEEGDFTH